MARTLCAYLTPERLPDHDTLQAALTRLAYRFKLDGRFDAATAQAYLPCTLEGEDAGLYLQFEALARVPEPAAAGLADPQRALLRLRWGGDAREHLSACLVAVALARDFGALLVDPDSGTVQADDALLKQAKRLHQENF